MGQADRGARSTRSSVLQPRTDPTNLERFMSDNSYPTKDYSGLVGSALLLSGMYRTWYEDRDFIELIEGAKSIVTGIETQLQDEKTEISRLLKQVPKSRSVPFQLQGHRGLSAHHVFFFILGKLCQAWHRAFRGIHALSPESVPILNPADAAALSGEIQFERFKSNQEQTAKQSQNGDGDGEIRKRRKKGPRNYSELMQFQDALKKGRRQSQEYKEIALEFTHGDEKKAENLLRKHRFWVKRGIMPKVK